MISTKEVLHVYLMPGMAANASIFEHIKLPEDTFEVHYLEWLIPDRRESLQDYALRMNKFIKHDKPILIGVSFGGVVVQEMSKYLDVQRLIIISSVKCREELPNRMRFAAKTGIYRLIPTGLMNYVDHFEKIAIGDFAKKRAKLYRQYLSVNNKIYLDWAIKHMVLWNCDKADEKVVHIHGDKDVIFPIEHIGNCIKLKGGTHIMIINRFRWFNRYLPEIILTGKINDKGKIEERI
ncbi:alpha/beta fold hydrolase [Autumnicola edwardsiae]|uniref:Alpha/beta hydrolase n=1 Tax=Autumnicola edwardsiae TaxID=3075594 RepID=A0ABU3CYI0_9FLAO|nr:alpha/beta hydrolase [Zunongwangia sp. F297]MDT0651412.1 alpha/beta hydrolase [Zunongwangia sp. F297]